MNLIECTFAVVGNKVQFKAELFQNVMNRRSKVIVVDHCVYIHQNKTTRVFAKLLNDFGENFETGVFDHGRVFGRIEDLLAALGFGNGRHVNGVRDTIIGITIKHAFVGFDLTRILGFIAFCGLQFDTA